MTITPATSNSPQVCARCYDKFKWSEPEDRAYCLIEPDDQHYHVTTDDRDERICCSCLENLKAELEVSE